MARFQIIVAASFLMLIAGLAETSWARGFGGMHGGGMRGGGMRMGGMPRANFGGMRGGGMPRANFGGMRPDANFGGMRPGASFGNRGGMRPGGGFGEARPGAADHRFPGASASGFADRGPAARDGREPGAEGLARRPDRNQLGNFLGLPSDGGMHKLANNPVGRDAVGRDAVRRDAVGRDAAGRNQLRRDEVRRNDVGRNQMRRNEVGRDARGMRRYSGDELRRRGDDVRRDFDGRGFYDADWYRRYPGAWYTRAWARTDLWAAMTWDSMDDYFDYGDTEPMYYDYGNTVTYQDNSVYMNGQDMGTSDQYYQQAQDLADTGAQAQPSDDVKWMPLGVFAMTHGDQNKANLILQLAVNKQGIIRGNYTATITNDTKPVQGSVDKKTQRAAWTIGDNKENVIETGVYNLTKDQAPALVHFGKDKTEQWVLVRLNKDDKQQSSQQ